MIINYIIAVLLQSQRNNNTHAYHPYTPHKSSNHIHPLSFAAGYSSEKLIEFRRDVGCSLLSSSIHTSAKMEQIVGCTAHGCRCMWHLKLCMKGAWWMIGKRERTVRRWWAEPDVKESQPAIWSAGTCRYAIYSCPPWHEAIALSMRDRQATSILVLIGVAGGSVSSFSLSVC